MAKTANAWCFTINNPTDWGYNSEHDVMNRLQGVCHYVVFQLEAGENGTPHYQGYCQTTTFRRTNTMTRILPHTSWLFARGSDEQNYNYCTKDGRLDGPWEIGVRRPHAGVQEAKTSDLNKAIQLLQETGNLERVAQEYPNTWVRNSKGLIDLASRLTKHRTEPPKVYWFWGGAGTGKSRTVREIAPLVQAVDICGQGNNPFLMGWNGEDDVVFEDLRTHQCTLRWLLKITDRYPCSVNVKYGERKWTAKRIFITTNVSPEDFARSYTAEDIAQLTRRITEVRLF